MQNRSGLHLVTGSDQLFARLADTGFTAGLMAIWLSPADASWDIAATLVAFLAYLLLARHNSRQSPVELQVYPDGRVHRAGSGSDATIGQMRNHSWSCGRYAVICIDTPGRPIRFVISRSLQQVGMYRVMMSWLVLGHPENEEQEQF